MKNSVTTKSSSYFSMALIMFIGLIYNVIEQDFFGLGVFLISSVVFVLVAVIKGRPLLKSTKSD